MKYLVYIVIILLNFNNCTAQKKVKMEQEIIIPQIDKEFEKFDITNFDTKDNNILKKEGDLYVKRITQSFGYAEHIITENSFFSTAKLYYKNLNIKKKGIMFNNGSNYGIWYEFNEEGKLIKEINTDAGYIFGWNGLLDYCEKNNIALIKSNIKSGGVPTEILKLEEEGRKIWQIMYYDKEQEKKFLVKLDGKSGELLSKKELEFLD